MKLCSAGRKVVEHFLTLRTYPGLFCQFDVLHLSLSHTHTRARARARTHTVIISNYQLYGVLIVVRWNKSGSDFVNDSSVTIIILEKKSHIYRFCIFLIVRNTVWHYVRTDWHEYRSKAFRHLRGDTWVDLYWKQSQKVASVCAMKCIFGDCI
jgi:hypothetical protein